MRDGIMGSQVLVAVACVAASFVAASCGTKDKTRSSPSPVATSTYPNIISASDVSKAPDQPMRALLAWFQAVQFRDTAQVHQLTAPSTTTRVTSANLDRAVQAIGPSLARPELVQARMTGDQAVLRVVLLSYKGTTTPVSSVPATFTLTHLGGSWRVSDVSVLFPKREPAYRPRGH